MRSALFLAGLLLSSVSWAAPQNLTVKNEGSFVYALAYKAGMAGAVAHDHVVHAPKLTGSGVYDPENISASSIDVTINVMDIVTDSDQLRKSVGLTTFLSDGQREEVLDHIRAKYQLYASQYTTISFKSTSATGTAEQITVTGDFTLRGVTKKITVPLEITEKDEGIVAVGQFKLKQSDYGYDPFSALFGALKVKDEVDVVLKINLQP